MNSFLENSYEFSFRPRPYSADLRSDWRISALLLALDKCRMKRASVIQLHALVWAMLAEDHGTQLKAALQGEAADPVPIRFDPAVARAIDLGVGMGLLTRDGKRIVSSSDGQAWLRVLIDDPSLMSHEKVILDSLGTVTMSAIERAIGVGKQ